MVSFIQNNFFLQNRPALVRSHIVKIMTWTLVVIHSNAMSKDYLGSRANKYVFYL
jgi:hypothetical protein